MRIALSLSLLAWFSTALVAANAPPPFPGIEQLPSKWAKKVKRSEGPTAFDALPELLNDPYPWFLDNKSDKLSNLRAHAADVIRGFDADKRRQYLQQHNYADSALLRSATAEEDVVTIDAIANRRRMTPIGDAAVIALITRAWDRQNYVAGSFYADGLRADITDTTKLCDHYMLVMLKSVLIYEGAGRPGEADKLSAELAHCTTSVVVGGENLNPTTLQIRLATWRQSIGKDTVIKRWFHHQASQNDINEVRRAVTYANQYPAFRALFSREQLMRHNIEGASFAQVYKTEDTMIANLANKDPYVRHQAADVLNRLGDRVFDKLVSASNGSDALSAEGAITVLGHKGRKALPTIIALLESNEPLVVGAAARALRRRQVDKDGIAALAASLQHENDYVWTYVVDTLDNAGPLGKEALREASLTEKDTFRKRALVRRLNQRPHAEQAIAHVANTLQKLRAPVLKMTPLDALEVGRYEELLTSSDPKTAYDASCDLLRRGATSDQLLPHLFDIMWRIQGQTCAEGVIASFGPKAIPSLVKHLNEVSDQNRIKVLRILSKLGPHAAPAIPSILAILERRGPRNDLTIALHVTAIRALDAMGQKASKATTQLLLDLKDEARYIRVAAARTLGSISQDAERVTPELITALQDNYVDVRLYAMVSLQRFGFANDPSVRDALLNTLNLRQSFSNEKALALLTMTKVHPCGLDEVFTWLSQQSAKEATQVVSDLLENLAPLLLSWENDDNPEEENPSYEEHSFNRVPSDKELAAIHAFNVDALPILDALMDHRDREIRVFVIQKLKSIKHSNTLLMLQNALRDEDPIVRVAAKNAMSDLIGRALSWENEP